MHSKEQISEIFRLAEISQELKNESAKTQKRKSQWILMARKATDVSNPSNCEVCGKHKPIAHGHHIEPLHKQFKKSTFNPEIVWLCPNHHAAVHLFLDRKHFFQWPDIEDFTEDEQEKILKIAIRGMK